MIFKRILISFISIMLLTLVACNGNDDAQRNENNDTISSMATDSSSKNYPHTKPIRIQEAKYKFIVSTNKQQINQNSQQWQKQTQQRQPQKNQTSEQPQQAQQPKQQQQNQQAAPTPKQNATPQNQGDQGVSQTEKRVVELTNAERRKQGLPDLQLDVKLSGVAKEKSKDMQAKGYFSHTSPTYGSPFDMMRDFGINYQAAGENIAQGQRSPEEVVQAWMNSEGHRKNILNPEFTHIGVGHETTANHWTQMFIKK